MKALPPPVNALGYGVLGAYILIFSIYAILIKAESIEDQERKQTLSASCFVPSLLISASETLKALISLILLAFESKTSETAALYTLDSLSLAMRKRDYRLV